MDNLLLFRKHRTQLYPGSTLMTVWWTKEWIPLNTFSYKTEAVLAEGYVKRHSACEWLYRQPFILPWQRLVSKPFLSNINFIETKTSESSFLSEVIALWVRLMTVPFPRQPNIKVSKQWLNGQWPICFLTQWILPSIFLYVTQLEWGGKLCF